MRRRSHRTVRGLDAGLGRSDAARHGKKISEARPTISSKKLKPWLPGRRLGPFAIPDAIIIGGGDVGSAGGIVAVVIVNGVGGDH